ncbi:MFS transporter [Microbacterium sp. NPDC087592]|uniref:MFS transporter n=1 Tax=Microbacterium sp. NPDC087592 TaxID=3364193 RepID=UPI0037FFE551
MRPSHPTFGIALLLTAQFMLVLDSTIVTVALPELGSSLGFPPTALQWVVTAYVLAFGGLLLTGARLGDAYGKLTVFQVGIGIFSAASLVGGLALDPTWLITARAVQGAGAALAVPGALALLVTNSPDETSRRRALAWFSAIGVAGGATGLLLGGILTQTVSWRWTLLINVPLGILVLLFARRNLSDTTRNPGRFDLWGAVLAAAMASVLVITMSGASEPGRTPLATAVGLVATAALIALLVLAERRAAAPLIRLELLRDRRRVGALVTGALVLGGQSSLMFMSVQYLQDDLGYSPTLAGVAFLPMTLGIFGMSRVIPRIVMRFGAAIPLLIGTAGLATSYALFALFTDTTDLVVILVTMLLNGVAAGLCFMPITSTVLHDVPPETIGSASGLLQTTQNLGSAVAVALVTAVHFAGTAAGESLPGFTAAFATIGGLALLGFIATATLVRPGKR